VAGVLKLRPKFLKVVDFTVEYNPNGLVFVAKRLFPLHRKINDSETAVSQGTQSIGPNAGAVRPTMGQRCGHGTDRFKIRGL
jgi:hypothetical protein